MVEDKQPFLLGVLDPSGFELLVVLGVFLQAGNQWWKPRNDKVRLPQHGARRDLLCWIQVNEKSVMTTGEIRAFFSTHIPNISADDVAWCLGHEKSKTGGLNDKWMLRKHQHPKETTLQLKLTQKNKEQTIWTVWNKSLLTLMAENTY